MSIIDANVGAHVDLPLDKVEAFCKKWGVVQFALWLGTAPTSDPRAMWTFWSASRRELPSGGRTG